MSEHRVKKKANDKSLMRRRGGSDYDSATDERLLSTKSMYYIAMGVGALAISSAAGIYITYGKSKDGRTFTADTSKDQEFSGGSACLNPNSSPSSGSSENASGDPAKNSPAGEMTFESTTSSTSISSVEKLPQKINDERTPNKSNFDFNEIDSRSYVENPEKELAALQKVVFPFEEAPRDASDYSFRGVLKIIMDKSCAADPIFEIQYNKEHRHFTITLYITSGQWGSRIEDAINAARRKFLYEMREFQNERGFLLFAPGRFAKFFFYGGDYKDLGTFSAR